MPGNNSFLRAVQALHKILFIGAHMVEQKIQSLTAWKKIDQAVFRV
jgi:hypothetical protein